MLICDTFIDDNCKKLLQKNINFEIKNKSLKRGKLVLYFQRNFHLVFVLDTIKKREKLEIPIPFAIEYHSEDDLMFFDYRMSTLSKIFSEAEPFLTLFTSKVVKNKFFDTILTINAN